MRVWLVSYTSDKTAEKNWQVAITQPAGLQQEESAHYFWLSLSAKSPPRAQKRTFK